MDERKVTTLGELPEELLFSHVFPFLSAPDLIKISQTCSNLRRLARDNYLWAPLFVKEFSTGSLAEAKVLQEYQLSWFQQYIQLRSLDYRLLNGLFSQYTIKSLNYSGLGKSDQSKENWANSDRFRFYYPPVPSDPSLFIRVLVNYRRWRVEAWRQGISPSSPCAGTLDEVKTGKGYAQSRTLCLSPSVYYRGRATPITEALFQPDFTPELIYMYRDELVFHCSEGSTSFASNSFGACSEIHRQEVVFASLGSLMRVPVCELENTQSVDVSWVWDGEQKVSAVLWNGGRWAVVGLTSCVLVWDLDIQQQNDEKGRSDEAVAVLKVKGDVVDSIHRSRTKVAVGCGDGIVQVFDLTKLDQLEGLFQLSSQQKEGGLKSFGKVKQVWVDENEVFGCGSMEIQAFSLHNNHNHNNDNDNNNNDNNRRVFEIGDRIKRFEVARRVVVAWVAGGVVVVWNRQSAKALYKIPMYTERSKREARFKLLQPSQGRIIKDEGGQVEVVDFNSKEAIVGWLGNILAFAPRRQVENEEKNAETESKEEKEAT